MTKRATTHHQTTLGHLAGAMLLSGSVYACSVSVPMDELTQDGDDPANDGGGGSPGSVPPSETGSGGEAAAGGSQAGGSDAGGSNSAGGQAGGMGGSSGGSMGGGGAPTMGHACGDGTKNPWIESHFATAPLVTGAFTSRTTVEMPAIVSGATGTNGKYAFFAVDEDAPFDASVAFVDVDIQDLASPDIYGGGFATSNKFPGAKVYVSNVYIEPNWPTWEDYDSTNYDGIVLDGAAEFYAECLTVANWNADSALDIKAQVAQFDRLETIGNGNRTLRFWKSGPHFIVDSTVRNETGEMMWFKNCDGAVVYVYDSTFNGASEVPENKIDCESGEAPSIVYLDTDPRGTGDMHPMFSAP